MTTKALPLIHSGRTMLKMRCDHHVVLKGAFLQHDGHEESLLDNEMELKPDRPRILDITNKLCRLFGTDQSEAQHSEAQHREFGIRLELEPEGIGQAGLRYRATYESGSFTDFVGV